MKDDIYIRYLRKHYSEHNTINNITNRTVVEFEGRKLYIGDFLGKMKKNYRDFLSGKSNMSDLMLTRFKALDEMGISWAKIRTDTTMESDIYIDYLREHYRNNGTINDINGEEVAEFNGQTINIGGFLSRIRSSHKFFLEGVSDQRGSLSELSTTRYQALEEMGIDWNGTGKYRIDTDIYIRYLREHYEDNGTINDIVDSAAPEYEGRKINIGNFLSRMRYSHQFFVRGEDNDRGSLSDLAIARYQALDEMNFDWAGPRRCYDSDKDIYIRYLREYYQVHGTINDIRDDDTVVFEEKTVNIGDFLKRMKRYHRESLSEEKTGYGDLSDISIARFQILEEMGIDWKKTRWDYNIGSDIYMDYLRKYYQENGTINDICSDVVVEFEGQTFNIGDFLSRIRAEHRRYIQGLPGRYGKTSKLSLSRYQILEELNIDWSGPNRSYNPDEDSYVKYLRKHYEKYGTINDIAKNAVVEFEGSQLKIGIFLQNMRSHHKKYVSNPNMNITPTLAERFAALDSLHYSWMQVRTRKAEDDLYIPFLREYYKEHGTINDIEGNFVVFYKGTKLDITTFLSTMRTLYKKVENGEEVSSLTHSRIQAMREMEFLWEKEVNDAYIDFLMEYYKMHGTINDIELDKIFIYNGKKLNPSRFLYDIRLCYNRYLEDRGNRSYNSPLLLDRYQKLNEMGFDWTMRLRGNVDDDIYIRYLKWRFNTYGTINDIDSADVVHFEGKEIKIGVFISNVRRKRRLYLAGSDKSSCNSLLFLARYRALDEMRFVWEPTLTCWVEKDQFIEYLKLHYAKHGTINDIKLKSVVLFEGKELQIGAFLSNIRGNYKKYLSGDPKAATPLLLKRYEELQRMEYNFSSIKTVNQEENHKPKSSNLLAARTSGLLAKMKDKFESDEKANLFVKLMRSEELQRTDRHKKYTLDYVSSIFGLDVREFALKFSGNGFSTDNNSSMVDGEVSLKEFASMVGHNYRALLYAIRLKENNLSNEDMDSLINRGVVETDYDFKWKVPNWIYIKYGNKELLNHFLESVGFSPKYVYEDMRKEVIPIEEAISDEAFRVNSRNDEYCYLRAIYKDTLAYYNRIRQETLDSSFVDEVLNTYVSTKYAAYSLNHDEMEVIARSLKHYTFAMREYQLYDVAFEKDDLKRKQKITDYGFDEADVERAFFMPLNFDEEAFVGKNSELYQRRALLRDLTINWGGLSDDDKACKISTYGITTEEECYIRKTRKDIDQAKKFFKK